MEEKQKEHSIFKITAIVLTVLLVIAIVVQIGVLISIKSKTERLKKQNENLPTISQPSTNTEISLNCLREDLLREDFFQNDSLQ